MDYSHFSFSPRISLKLACIIFLCIPALFSSAVSAMPLCDSSLNRYGIEVAQDPVGFTHPIFSEPRWRCKKATIGLSDHSVNTSHETELTSFESAANKCQQIALSDVFDSEGPIIQNVVSNHESTIQHVTDEGTLLEAGLETEACFMSTGGATPDDVDLGSDLRKIGGHSVSFAPHLYRYISGVYDDGGTVEDASLTAWDLDTNNNTQYPSAIVEYIPEVEQSRCFDPLCEPGTTAANQYKYSPVEPGLGTFDLEIPLFPSQFPGLVPLSLHYSSHAARVQHEDTYQSLVGGVVLGWHLSYDKTLVLDNAGPGLVTTSPPSAPKKIYIITPTDDRLIFQKSDSGQWRNISHPGVRAVIEKVSADTYEVSRPDGYQERYTVFGNRGKLNFVRYSDGREITITRSNIIGNEYYTLEQNYPVASTKVHTFFGAPLRIESLNNPSYAFDFNYTSDYMLSSITRPDGSQISFSQHRDSADMPDVPTISNLPAPFLDKVSLHGEEVISISYDTLGRAIAVNSIGGSSYSVAYNDAQTTTVTAPYGAQYSLTSTQQAINASDYWGDLETINVVDAGCGACGFTEDTQYQESGLISSQSRTGEQSYSATFGASGLIDSLLLDNSKHRDFTWNIDQQQLTEMTGSDIITTRFDYTDDHVSSTTFDGGDASRTVDTPRVNRQITQISGLGDNVVSINYSTQGFISGVTDSAGRSFTMSNHNHLGQPRRITDPNGIHTDATYDIMGRLLSIMRDGKERLSVAYTPTGQPEAVTLDGNVLNYTYDGAFRLSEIAGADGEQIVINYLANGLVDSTIHSHNGVSQSTTFSYNAEGNITQTNHLFENVALQRNYNARGQITQETDGTNTTTYQYDANAYLIAVTENGETTQYQRDPLGRLTTLTTNGGHATSFAYTGLGEQTQQLNSNWGYRDYSYGPTGNLTQASTPLLTHSYQYTAVDDVLSKTSQRADNSMPAITTNYGYDDASDSSQGKNHGIGHLTSIENGFAAYSYRYDEQGNLTQSLIEIDETGLADPVMMPANAKQINYAYDSNNKINSITYPNGDVVFYQRDPASQRITSISRNGNSVAQLIYDNALHPSTSTVFASQLSSVRQFDDLGRVTAMDIGEGLLIESYDYSPAFNIAQITRIDALNLGDYDNPNATPITPPTDDDDLPLDDGRGGANPGDGGDSGSDPGDDGTGNNGRTQSSFLNTETSETDSPGSDEDGGDGQFPPQPDDEPSGPPGSDEDGGDGQFPDQPDDDPSTPPAPTTEIQTFSYDAQNRLIAATGTYGSLQYAYDANANRSYFGEGNQGIDHLYEYGTSRLLAQNQADGTTVNNYVYDDDGNTIQDGQLNLSYDAEGRLSQVTENGSLIATYTYDPYGRRVSKKTSTQTLYFYYDEQNRLLEEVDDAGNLVRQYIYADSDELIAVFSADHNDVLAVHNDYQGAPVLLTDSNQTVVWASKRKPYGETLVTIDTVTFPLRFSNQYYDKETGYHYNQQRYYKPQIGRYLRNDPIGLEGGHNPYNFAFQNPLKYIDPDGRQAEAFWMGLDNARRTQAGESDGDIARTHARDGLIGLGAGLVFIGAVYAPGYLAVLSTRNPKAYMAGMEVLGGEAGLSYAGAGTSGGYLVLSHASRGITRTPNEAGVVREFVTEFDQVFFRVFSGDSTVGGFLTAVRPRNSAFAQEVLALPRANSAKFIQEVLVPAGTRLRRSRAAPIQADDIFPNRRGGAEQFELLDLIPKNNFGPGVPLQ